MTYNQIVCSICGQPMDSFNTRLDMPKSVCQNCCDRLLTETCRQGIKDAEAKENKKLKIIKNDVEKDNVKKTTIKKSRKECIDSWISSDKDMLRSAILKVYKNKTLTKQEFEYDICNICPYRCNRSVFCWEKYLFFKNINIEFFINIIETLIEGHYKESDINNFSYFRFNICTTCDTGCTSYIVMNNCFDKYTEQMKDTRTMYNASCYKNKCLIEKAVTSTIATVPQLIFTGSKMNKIISELWGVKPSDNTICKERNNSS